MVVAARCTSVLLGFGWELRIDEDMLVSSSARLAWSLGVCSLSTLIVQRSFLSVETHIVGLSVHMGKTGLGVFMHDSLAAV